MQRSGGCSEILLPSAYGRPIKGTKPVDLKLVLVGALVSMVDGSYRAAQRVGTSGTFLSQDGQREENLLFYVLV